MIKAIEKKIENLKKLKAVLKDKIAKVDLQLQREKTKISKNKETERLKHIKNQKKFFQK